MYDRDLVAYQHHRVDVLCVSCVCSRGFVSIVTYNQPVIRLSIAAISTYIKHSDGYAVFLRETSRNRTHSTKASLPWDDYTTRIRARLHTEILNRIVSKL